MYDDGDDGGCNSGDWRIGRRSPRGRPDRRSRRRSGPHGAAAVLTDLLLEKAGSTRLEDGGTLVQIKQKDTTWHGEFWPGKVCTRPR